MKVISKIKKLELANRSLRRVLTNERKNIKYKDTITDLKLDLEAKDQVIGRQSQELGRIHRSKLWKLYLIFRKFKQICGLT